MRGRSCSIIMSRIKCQGTEMDDGMNDRQKGRDFGPFDFSSLPSLPGYAEQNLQAHLHVKCRGHEASFSSGIIRYDSSYH